MPYTKEEMPETIDTIHEDLGSKNGNSHEAPAAIPLEIDYADALRSCDNLAQLQRAWGAIPTDKKPDFNDVKNEVKEKLSHGKGSK